MSENNKHRKKLPSFEEYAQAIMKILNLISTINQLSEYYNLNQISSQYLNEPFTLVSPQKVANYFGVQYNRVPSLVQQTQYNPVALVTKAYQIAEQVQPDVLDSLASMYDVEPEIVKSLQVYVELAEILPKLVSSQSVQVSNNLEYVASPKVLENY
jgi:plasmid maintenance system antidote protein VapI